MTAMTNNRPTRRSSRVALLGAGFCLLAFALPALAQNVLRDVSYSAGTGGAVDITLELASPVGDIPSFTTEAPPRIALDLPDTRNAFDQRRLTIGSGATSAVSVVEAEGRTRVVIDLFRQAAHSVRTEGNLLIVSVGGGTNTASSALANPADPAKRTPGLEVANVDFRRGDDGAGRLVLSFTGEGAETNLRTEGDKVIIDVANAPLPASLQQRLDVADFATPVRSIESRGNVGGARLVLNTAGAFESLAYQTGNEYVVEVSPKAAPAAATTRVGAAEGPRYSGRPVTFNFQDIPVRTVLQLIAEESNLNVVASDTVQGNVTLRLINVPWDQALDIVLRSKNLDQRRDGTVIWVAPQPELAAYEQAKEDARIALEERSETVSEYIPVNYGSAEDIAKLLTEESKTNVAGGQAGGGTQSQQRGFLSPRGSVTFDRRTNTLLVNDIPPKLVEIRQLVALLDRPVDQVLIEARIVIATEDFSREIGARFGVSAVEQRSGNTWITSGNLDANLETGNSVLEGRQNNTGYTLTRGLNVNLPAQIPNAGALALSVLGNNYLLDMELSALQTEGRGEVVANPRVITANQQEAVIKQGEEVGYVTLQQSGAGTGQFTVEFKEVVLELRVTPTITQDNRVFLSMHVTKDEVREFVETPLFRVPSITKRELNTSVLVENGQTVVLGGVYEFKTAEDLRKVPFLGDIPGLGNLFRNRSRSNSKAELLVFVTPRILRLDQLSR